MSEDSERKASRSMSGRIMRAMAKVHRIATTRAIRIQKPPETGNECITPRVAVARIKKGALKAETFKPPARIGKRYRILQQVGKGGMGLLYKARDQMLNIDVAVKFLPPKLMLDADAFARFKHEASLAMSLSHEHIVKLHNIEIERSRVFLVMEYVDGEDLRRILQRVGRLPLTPVRQVLASCALALDYAHERNVLHLDLKPENLMISGKAILKIVDLGTARRVGCHRDGEMVEGSPPYMSPEQLLGKPVDRRADVYSLGAIIYELLSGKPCYPFDAETETILNTHPAPLDRSVPESVARTVYTAMNKDPDKRWDSAGMFCEEFMNAADAK